MLNFNRTHVYIFNYYKLPPGFLDSLKLLSGYSRDRETLNHRLQLRINQVQRGTIKARACINLLDLPPPTAPPTHLLAGPPHIVFSHIWDFIFCYDCIHRRAL